VRHAIFLPPHGSLADPSLVVEIAVAAEQAGWDGIFLWDHMWRPSGKPQEVADAWICLSAIAVATTRIRLGPMVTPLARRRPQKVARETVTLDRLSAGRLTFGVGLGVDTGGELGRFDEETDDVARGDMLDEALSLLLALWSGQPVRHDGTHFTAEDVSFIPVAVQTPRIPVWAAARGGASARPLRRAATLDGLFPVHATVEQVVTMLEAVTHIRGTLDGYDVAVTTTGGEDPKALGSAGVTWMVRSIAEGAPASAVLTVASAGPPM